MNSVVSGKHTLVLKLKAWHYANPARQTQYNAGFAKFVDKKLVQVQRQNGRDVKWKVEPDQTQLAVAYQQHANKSFMPLEMTFSLVSSKTQKTNFALFDELFGNISRILKDKKLRVVLDAEKTTLICWSLYDRNKPNQPKLSRWVLPVPEKPIFFPAEHIEQVLYNLVSIKLRQIDSSHTPCAPSSVLSCIEAQLFRQKEAFVLLSSHLADLESCTAAASIPALIENNIATLESIDSALSTLVSLLDNHIGRHPSPKAKFRFVRRLISFIRGPMATIAIDDANVEAAKRKARTELQTFQRISPILAAHIRLRDSSRRAELQRVCDAARNGPEKTEMPEKLALSPACLRDRDTAIAQLKRVRKHYEDTHAKVVAEVEALNKLVGAELAKKGKEVWNIRGKLGRFGRRKTPKIGKLCVVEEKEPRSSEESVWGENEKLGW
ncbi:hypothetical protein OQA88_9046 [Cercophora sp. LCS_1]